MKTMSLSDFNHWYWQTFPNSTYRRGQAFLNLFVKDSEPYYQLWDEQDQDKISDMIWKIILQYDWDCNSIQVLREDLLMAG